MSPVPVLLLARELNLGGVERDLARLAIGLRGSRFAPHVVCFRPGGLRYEEILRAGVPILDLGLTSFRSPAAARAAWRLASYIRRRGVGVVHVMDSPGAAFGVPVSRAAGAPVVLACQLSYRGMLGGLGRRLSGFADRLADRVVSNCQAVLDDLVARHGVPREKTALVYNGVEADVFRPPEGGGRDRSVLPPALREATFVAGAVCALRPEKRLDVLISAFAKSGLARSGGRLALVGGGVMEAAWKRLAGDLGVAAAVHFEPATADVAPWLRAFDLFVLSSEIEAFPNGLLEAMACGCACAASDVGGVPEMLGDDGWTFPAGDADALARLLARAAADPEGRADLGVRARLRAETKFPLIENLRATSALYERTLREKAIAIPPPGPEGF